MWYFKLTSGTVASEFILRWFLLILYTYILIFVSVNTLLGMREVELSHLSFLLPHSIKVNQFVCNRKMFDLFFIPYTIFLLLRQRKRPI